MVVVNHALFMADLVLREEGVTDLLPEADTVIFDEAHQLPDTATRFLGSSVSTHQLLDFGRALEAAGLAYAREAARWSDVSRHLETARASCGWSVRRWTSCRAARRPSRRCPRPRNSTRRWRCCARPWTRPPTRWARSPKSIPT